MSENRKPADNARFDNHRILRHPDRIQADDVVLGLFQEVRYATEVAA